MLFLIEKQLLGWGKPARKKNKSPEQAGTSFEKRWHSLEIQALTTHCNRSPAAFPLLSPIAILWPCSPGASFLPKGGWKQRYCSNDCPVNIISLGTLHLLLRSATRDLKLKNQGVLQVLYVLRLLDSDQQPLGCPVHVFHSARENPWDKVLALQSHMPTATRWHTEQNKFVLSVAAPENCSSATWIQKWCLPEARMSKTLDLYLTPLSSVPHPQSIAHLFSWRAGSWCSRTGQRQQRMYQGDEGVQTRLDRNTCWTPTATAKTSPSLVPSISWKRKAGHLCFWKLCFGKS